MSAFGLSTGFKLNRVARRLQGAVAPSGVFAMTRAFTGRGSSSFSGTGASVPAKALDGLLDAAISNPALAMVAGSSGGTAVSVTNAVTSDCANPAVRDGDWMLSYVGNGLTTPADLATALAQEQAAVATIAAAQPAEGRVLHAPVYNKGTIFSGASYALKGSYTRLLEGLYPAATQDWSYLLSVAPPADAADIAAQAQYSLPPSYESTTSVDHFNDKGYLYSHATFVEPFARACAGGIPFIADGRRVFSRVGTANSVGGFVADLATMHSLAGTTVSTTDPDFDATVQADRLIRLTRRTATVLKGRYKPVPLTLTKTVGGVTVARTVTLRVSIGVIGSTPAIVKWGGGGLSTTFSNRPFAGVPAGGSKKFALVMGMRITDPARDSATFQILGGPAIYVLKLSPSSGLRVYVRDSAGVTVARAGTSTSYINTTGGWNWLFFEADLSLGASSYTRMVVNDTAIAGDIAIADGMMNLAAPAAIMAVTASATSGPGTADHPAEICGPFLYADIIGVTDPAIGASRRALFRNPAAPTIPLDLGADCAVGGVLPYVALRGNAADLWQGGDAAQGMTARNFGTGGDFFLLDAGMLQTL